VTRSGASAVLSWQAVVADTAEACAGSSLYAEAQVATARPLLHPHEWPNVAYVVAESRSICFVRSRGIRYPGVILRAGVSPTWAAPASSSVEFWTKGRHCSSRDYAAAAIGGIGRHLLA
jgi:hypothetical protein